MTPDEAREHLKNSNTPDHIADEARAVLAPIVTAEAAATEAEKAAARAAEEAAAEAASIAAEEEARATLEAGGRLVG